MTKIECVKNIIGILKVRSSISKMELYIHLNFLGITKSVFDEVIESLQNEDVIQETLTGDIRKSNAFNTAYNLVGGAAFL